MRKSVRQLVTAGAVAVLAVIGPAAAAQAACRPPGPPPPHSSSYNVKGYVLLRGFPKGTRISGGLGTYKENCVVRNNGRRFTAREGDALNVTIAASYSVRDGCFVRPSYSLWHLYVVSPGGYRGEISFYLGQARSRGSYHMYCVNSYVRGSRIACSNGSFGRIRAIVVHPVPVHHP